MKKIISICFLFFSILFTHAQKELWGVNSGSQIPSDLYYGNITKYDIIGENPAIIHEFDSVNGFKPMGKLFLASNGKLYGTTQLGGILGPEGTGTSSGILYEYDLILNKYRVVKYFGFGGVNTSSNPETGVIEPINGKLYGAIRNTIFKYDLATEVVTFYNELPLNLLTITTEFLKAADGNLYSVAGYGFCQNPATTPLWNGCIVKFNMTTNILSVVRALDCSGTLEGNYPIKLIETSPGILYGTTYNGGIYLPSFGSPYNATGVLFEYNILTNLFTKKIDFNGYNSGISTGGIPIELIKGDNGKLYGLCQEGGIPQGNTSTNQTDFRGTLFEYTIASNIIEVKQYFGLNNLNGGENFANYVRYPTSLIKTSLGNFIGTIPNSALFIWNKINNLITLPNYNNVNPNLINVSNNYNLIEICRKPSYQEILVNTFNPCAGSTFTYNVQNTNATSYIWKKGTIALPTQTTGILNLENVTASDNGVYTCTMVNECGTTITMPLTVTVGCLSINEIENYKENITLYPNPTKGNLNIKIPEQNNLTVSNVSIINMLGQLVYVDSLNRNLGTTKITVDVTKLEIGIYNVVLKTDKGDWNGKFVKN